MDSSKSAWPCLGDYKLYVSGEGGFFVLSLAFGRIDRLLTSNIDHKVRRSSQSHYFASHIYGEHFCSIQPCRTVEHPICATQSAHIYYLVGRVEKHTVPDHKKVDAQNSKTFADAIISVLEFTLHDSCIDFNDDNST